jgi:hypothetical protein
MNVAFVIKIEQTLGIRKVKEASDVLGCNRRKRRAHGLNASLLRGCGLPR